MSLPSKLVVIATALFDRPATTCSPPWSAGATGSPRGDPGSGNSGQTWGASTGGIRPASGSVGMVDPAPCAISAPGSSTSIIARTTPRIIAPAW